MSDLSTITRPVETPAEEGDHDRFAHIVLEGYRPEANPEEFVSAGVSVAEGIINGTPVRALCGKTWVPTHDPRRYPICPTCKDIAARQGFEVPTA